MLKHITLLVLFCNILAAASINEFNLDNGYAWFENSNALINCTATSHELITQETICDFKYKGTPTITLNTSFVFNSADGVTPKSISLWQNISHIEYEYQLVSTNNSISFGNVSSISSSSSTCAWGAGATKRKVTFTNSSTRVYCFDSYIVNNGIYTLYSVFPIQTLVQVNKYYYDWVDISAGFDISTFGTNKVATKEASWVQNQLRRVKFVYDTKPNSNGKFDIYFHTGSAQAAKNNPSLIKLILDPWWNSTWAHVRDINTTGAFNSGNAPYTMCVIINSTIARGSNNNCTDLRIVSSDDTILYPSFVQYCQANLSNIYQLADTNSTLMCANITNGALQMKLYYGNPSAANISDNGTVFKLFKDASDGTTQGAFATYWSGVMSNNVHPYPFLGANLFYTNDTGTGMGSLGWKLNTDNKSTIACEAAVIPETAPDYFMFCGASYGTGNVTNGVCGNYPVGFSNILDGTNQYGTGAMNWSYSDGAAYHAYGYKMAVGNLTIVQTTFMLNRSHNELMNGTQIGANLQTYSLSNITAVSFSTGWSSGVADKMAFGQVACFDALNQSYNVTLGTETNFSSPLAPSIINLSLAPTVPYDSNNLYCAFYAEDNDSASLNMTVRWFNNSAYVTSETRLNEPVNATYNFTLSNAYTLPWENWLCEVNITDSSYTTKLNSSNITIYNKLPNASVVNGGAHVFGIPLTCSAQLVDLDLTHILDANMSYLINGTSAPTYTEQFFNKNNGDMVTNITGTVVDITVGSNWTCYLNVSDNWNMTSTLLTSNYTVTIGAGTSPTSSISISPVVPVDIDNLMCSATLSDIDGHLLTGNISWYLNGSATATSFTTFTNVASGSTQTSTLSSIATLPSENWSCLINVTDGYWQISNMSSNVTIATTYIIPPITINISTHNYTWDDGTTNSVVHTVEAFYADYDDLIYTIIVFAFSFVITKTIPQTMMAAGVGFFVVFFLVGGNIYFMVGSIVCIIIGLIYKQVVG